MSQPPPSASGEKRVPKCGFCKIPGHTVRHCTAPGIDQYKQAKAARRARAPELSPADWVYSPYFIVFDCETTGLDPSIDRIIQLSAQLICLPLARDLPPSNFKTRTLNLFIKNRVTIHPSTIPIHNISQNFLDEHGEEPDVAFLSFKKWVEACKVPG